MTENIENTEEKKGFTEEVKDQVKTEVKKQVNREVNREINKTKRSFLSSLGIRGPLTIEAQVKRFIRKIF